MDKKVKAIVTRAVPYREADLILTLVSLEEGRLTASAKSCLKPGAKLRYAAAPMNFGEYMLSGKGDRYIVTDCVQYDSFSPITADIDRYYAACLILEMLARLSPEAQPSLFLHSVNELKAMAYENKAAADAVCDFCCIRSKTTVLDWIFPRAPLAVAFWTATLLIRNRTASCVRIAPLSTV